jgi:hypothetical protein
VRGEYHIGQCAQGFMNPRLVDIHIQCRTRDGFILQGFNQGGFFDDLKVIFSKEGQQNLNSYKEREKEEAFLAQVNNNYNK